MVPMVPTMPRLTLPDTIAREPRPPVSMSPMSAADAAESLPTRRALPTVTVCTAALKQDRATAAETETQSQQLERRGPTTEKWNHEAVVGCSSHTTYPPYPCNVTSLR